MGGLGRGKKKSEHASSETATTETNKMNAAKAE
jgi:hypothetical protein